jgi:hypothetical protein
MAMAKTKITNHPQKTDDVYLIKCYEVYPAMGSSINLKYHIITTMMATYIIKVK